MGNYLKKTDKDGATCFYNDKGNYHRLDGPAVEWANGTKFWYADGELHRLDGPACKYIGGSKFWYINGQQFTEEEFNKHQLVVEHILGKIINEVLDE